MPNNDHDKLKEIYSAAVKQAEDVLGDDMGCMFITVKNIERGLGVHSFTNIDREIRDDVLEHVKENMTEPTQKQIDLEELVKDSLGDKTHVIAEQARKALEEAHGEGWYGLISIRDIGKGLAVEFLSNMPDDLRVIALGKILIEAKEDLTNEPTG